MNKIQVAIVGLGDHCIKSHIKYLLASCDISVICDTNPNALKNSDFDYPYKEELSITTDYESVLNNPEIDAVFIMTPDRYHTSQLVAAVEAGKHVFCEKPLACTIEEYEKLEKAFALAEEKRLVITTCHPRRFDTPFEVVQSFMNNGLIFDKPLPGKVLNFEFYFHYSKPSKTGLHPSLMYDHLNHEVDAMHYIFGPRDIQHAVKHYDSETAFHVTGLRQDGISFSFIGQRKMKDTETYPEYMRVNFEGGSLQVDLYKGEAVLLSGKSYTTWYDPGKFKTDYTKRFYAVNRNFIQSIEHTAIPYLTADEMLMNTKLAIDLNEKKFVEY